MTLTEVDDLFPEDTYGDYPPPDHEDEPDEPSPATEFESVYDFVDEHLVVLYARKMRMKQDRVWCPRWFEHPEAVSRLESLWRAYEHLRLEPGTGMSVWWRDHADHHMRVLFATDGPFEGCSVDQGHGAVLEPLAVEPMTDTALREAMSINLTLGDDDE